MDSRKPAQTTMSRSPTLPRAYRVLLCSFGLALAQIVTLASPVAAQAEAQARADGPGDPWPRFRHHAVRWMGRAVGTRNQTCEGSS